MSRTRLTKAEREALCMVLDEFLAGHDAEMAASAFGLAESEGATLLKRLESANQKLTSAAPLAAPEEPR